MNEQDRDTRYMLRALQLARLGEGRVEPNPQVGCVIVRGDRIVGEGWHARFGGAHAEVEALRAAGEQAAGATMYVTLEPCSHHGKTPPCSEAVVQARLARVVIAMVDPFPRVSGRGVARLEEAGIAVEVGVLDEQARDLNAPYLKLLRAGRPWTIAKWAMTLDGRIATHAGESRWISNDRSRAVVHQLRGRMDAIVVGRGTAQFDDPLLTARPPGPRTPLRIVLDSRASLSLHSKLVETIDEAPVLVAAGPDAPEDRCRQLRDAGCEVIVCQHSSPQERWLELLDELGRRRLTNLLVEGGAGLLGTLFDARAIDELHVFVAPKLVGGEAARGPIGGRGVRDMSDALRLRTCESRNLEGDLYVWGRLGRTP